MIAFIIYIVFSLLLLLILYKITKILWKAFLFTFLISLIILGIFAYFVYIDVSSLMEKQKLLLVVSNEKIQTGYIFSDQPTSPITYKQLTTFNEHYPQNIDLISQDKYRVIFIYDTAFQDTPETIAFQNITFRKQNLINALNANTSQEFINTLSEDKENLISTQEISQDELIKYKAYIAGLLLKPVLENPSTLVSNLKEGNIKLHNSIINFLIKQIPTSLLVNNLKDKIKLENGNP
jgi:hypothetical protein